MLRHTKIITGCKIVSSDGIVGKVADLLFDERSLTFRYLVAHVGPRFSGQLVLLSFKTVEDIDEDRRALRVSLRRRAVEASPSVSTHNAISMEAQLLLGKYRQWTPAHVKRLPPSRAKNISNDATRQEKKKAEDVVEVGSRLRSVREITGYRIAATDGDIGHLKDLIVDDGTWNIEQLIANAGNWLFQRKVQIPSAAIQNIYWAERRVHVSMRRAEIKNTPKCGALEPVEDPETKKQRTSA